MQEMAVDVDPRGAVTAEDELVHRPYLANSAWIQCIGAHIRVCGRLRLGRASRRAVVHYASHRLPLPRSHELVCYPL